MRRERLTKEPVHDTYKAKVNPREPTMCPECGVVFHQGRWQWLAAPAETRVSLCPACQRGHDHNPGGYLTLSGEFFREHRDEILLTARAVEAREKAEHPLHRIMDVEEQADGVLITTTAMELARAISDAVHHTYQGKLDYHYTDGTNILRVAWKR
jgi:NMD protein affecting ribosome stability and mRNA decay